MGELIFNVLLFLAMLVLAINSLSIPIQGTDYLVRYWPMAILIILMILMAYKIYGIVMKMKAKNEPFTFDFGVLKTAPVIRLMLACVWLIIYAWVLPYVGYVIATIVFCVGIMYLLGVTSFPKALLASFAVTVVLFAIFSWGLDVSLPRGYGPLEAFGKWLEYLI